MCIRDRLKHAEILAMRQMSDAIVLVNKNLERLNARFDRVHEDVTTLKAQDSDGAIRELKVMFKDCFDGLREDMTKARETNDQRFERVEARMNAELANRDARINTLLVEGMADRSAIKLSIATLREKIMPLTAVFGTAVAAVIAIAVEKVF